MSVKQSRTYDKLLEVHKEARQARRKAASSRREIKGIDGRNGVISVLSSPAGAKAVEAELEALKAERRALKRLYAFVTKHANSVIASIKARAAEQRARKIKSSKLKSSGIKTATIKTKRQDSKMGAGAPAGNLNT